MNADWDRYPAGTKVDLDDILLGDHVRSVLNELVGVPFETTQRDWVGDVLEAFRAISAKRIGGQFFTDQRVTELAINLLEFEPELGDDLVDVCAGTGGFLLAAARKWHSSNQVGNGGPPNILGIEVDHGIASFANSNLQAELGTGDHVFRADSLARPDEWSLELRRRVMRAAHRCLASNPPFGTKITIKDGRVLRDYDLAHVWSKRGKRWEPSRLKYRPTPPDILFIERNLDLAQPGIGRAALVLPYQMLSGPSLGYVREWLLRQARIRAIIDLPAETFQPWTG
ncbi:MAG: N-6 DNA methylase, partial [Chloroflexota bacterium]